MILEFYTWGCFYLINPRESLMRNIINIHVDSFVRGDINFHIYMPEMEEGNTSRIERNGMKNGGGSAVKEINKKKWIEKTGGEREYDKEKERRWSRRKRTKGEEESDDEEYGTRRKMEKEKNRPKKKKKEKRRK